MLAAVTLLAGLLTACGASLNSPSLMSGGGGVVADTTQASASLGTGSGAGASKAGFSSSKQTASGAGVPTIAPEVRGTVTKVANGLAASSTPGNVAYKIGPQDVLDVSVFQVPDLSKTVQVGENGTIGMPLIGEVPASGRTVLEVQNDVTRLLRARYLQKPQVTVVVKEYNSQRVIIEGAVKKPGVIPMRGQTTLLQVIVMSEGLDQIADSNVVVFRQGPQGRMAARFDIAEIRAGTAEDPVLQPGDTIIVGTSFWKEQFNSVLKALPLVSLFALL